MRLLNTKQSDTGNLEVQEFMNSEIPPYAIFSHAWGKDEVSYPEIKDADAKKKSGYEKIIQCCLVARSNGFEHVWIDTCCIDKRSSEELSELFNSMYRWYRNAQVCYTYLGDVQSEDEIPKSRWFTRGWTLQELIAPPAVIFLNAKWEVLGNKADFRYELSECTRIPAGVLLGEEDIEAFSIAQRMSWAARRQTSRVEDRAYSLMGIFGVNMPLLYGEGENAFFRLQEEIMRISDDHSLFAWSSPDNCGGMLAISPAAFANSHSVVRFNPFGTLDSPFTMSSRGVYLDLRFIGVGSKGLGLAILLCKERSGGGRPIAIYLRDLFMNMTYFERVQSGYIQQLDLTRFKPSQYPVRSICVQVGRTASTIKANTMRLESVPPEQVYHNEKLKQLMDFENPLALVDAVKAGHEDNTWLLLSRSDTWIDVTDQDGRTSLSWAAEKGNKGIVKLLVDRGANIETRDNLGGTPLSWAMRKGNAAIVSLLLESGAAPESHKPQRKAMRMWPSSSFGDSLQFRRKK